MRQVPLALIRRRHPVKSLQIGSSRWRFIESKARPGAPALVLLPGTLGTGELFWNQIAALRGRARILALTYPRHSNPRLMADQIVRIAERRGIRRFAVLGSSLGGYLAQTIAGRHRSRVAHLFIGNSFAEAAKVMPVEVLRTLPPYVHRNTVSGSVRKWNTSEPVFATLRRLLLDNAHRQITAQELKARVLTWAAGPVVPRIDLPRQRITLIDCLDDPLIPGAVHKEMAARYQGAEFHKFPVGGHYPYVTRAKAYSAIVTRRLFQPG